MESLYQAYTHIAQRLNIPGWDDEIANSKKPGKRLLECWNINSVEQVFLFLKVPICLTFLLLSEHIRNSSILLLLNIRLFYLL
jgi:hypothetical protein